MPDPSTRPFTTFNFAVTLVAEDNVTPICSMGFSEVSGLEITMEPKTIREGGNNGQVFHLLGPVAYGQVSLKRGMTADYGLWTWADQVASAQGGARANALISVLAADGQQTTLTFQLTGCLPVKLKAPDLNAQSGIVAVEELLLVYETLRLQNAPAGPPPASPADGLAGVVTTVASTALGGMIAEAQNLLGSGFGTAAGDLASEAESAVAGEAGAALSDVEDIL